MNTDRTTQTMVEAWLADGFTAQPDVETMLDSVRAGVAATPQRRHRWWPFARSAALPVPERGPAPARGFTMFSVLKFVAAGVIVALFGGFLLTGLLTTPQPDEAVPAAVTASASPEAAATSSPTEEPEPTTLPDAAATETPTLVDSGPTVRSDILPGVALTVEEVEPGVFRIIDDGVRDVASRSGTDGVVAGLDGSVWITRQKHFYRLGDRAEHAWFGPTIDLFDFQVASDGTVWTFAARANGSGRKLRSYDHDGWTVREPSSRRSFISDFQVADDRTVWVRWHEPDRRKSYTAAFGPDDWQPPQPDVLASGDGDAVLLTEAGPVLSEPLRQELVFGRTVEPSAQGWLRGPWVEIGVDGTVWAAIDGSLVRLDDQVMAEWTSSSALPPMAPEPTRPLVAADGSLWVAHAGFDDPASRGGIGHFDGETWAAHLQGFRVVAMDLAPDGSLWLRAREAGKKKGVDLLVITPEAAADANVEGYAAEAVTTSARREWDAVDAPSLDPSRGATTDRGLTVRTGILPGVALTVEEVAPGMYRIVGDGVRDLAGTHHVDVGHDGSVWSLDPPGVEGFFRLGAEPIHAWPDGEMLWQFAVALDGTVWTFGGSGNGPHQKAIRSFDGDVWTVHRRAWRAHWPNDLLPSEPLAVAPDGTVWAAWWDGDEKETLVVARLGPDGWQPLGPPLERKGDHVALYPTDDGLRVVQIDWDPGKARTYRYDDSRWQQIGPAAYRVIVGSDGTIWQYRLARDDAGRRRYGDGGTLARFDGSEWREFDWDSAWEPSPFTVADDGSLWTSRLGNVSRFDGDRWERFPHIPGTISLIEPAADGAVWVVVTEPGLDWHGPSNLHVITPEAVATAE